MIINGHLQFCVPKIEWPDQCHTNMFYDIFYTYYKNSEAAKIKEINDFIDNNPHVKILNVETVYDKDDDGNETYCFRVHYISFFASPKLNDRRMYYINYYERK